jgi:hypothetical protein
MAIHMQTGDNRYRLARIDDGRVAEHFNDRLCRRVGGVPDYTDPDLFPVLWDDAAVPVGPVAARAGRSWEG